MCGDHAQEVDKEIEKKGSPPHVRGPRGSDKTPSTLLGITPACAGTTIGRWLLQMNNWDHPRMCGDHIYPREIATRALGSPPHVRGPPMLNKPFVKSFGITPACAGTTVSISLSILENRDHPRMCGDHGQVDISSLLVKGSPPHVRGPLILNL